MIIKNCENCNLEINIYIKNNNRLNYTNSKNIYYSVSNLPNHVRNSLMALVNH